MRLGQDRYLAMLKTAFGNDILKWLSDASVIEVMLNPDGRLWVEHLAGEKRFTGTEIPAERAETLIKLVASYKGLVIDEKNPEVATELPIGGARFQGWLPPVVDQPTFAIRQQATKIFTLENYVQEGALSQKHQKVLIDAIQTRQNIIVIGGTGSGKTTLTNALLHELKGADDRVLILEDLPELQVDVDDKVHMVTTPMVSMRQLVKGSLRMRPDRIIVGEVRDGVALDMLKAWNTGHPGGICTLHANSVESAPLRLENLIQEVVMNVSRELIVEAVDLLVFIARDKQGKHKVQNLARLDGFDINKGGYQISLV